MSDANWEEIKAVLQEYQPKFQEFAEQGEAQAALARVNWEKMQRFAKNAAEAREIAERVLNPNRTFELGDGMMISG